MVKPRWIGRAHQLTDFFVLMWDLTIGPNFEVWWRGVRANLANRWNIK